MARAIVSVTNDLYTDNRVNKVCLFLVSQGYDVLLVGRKRKNSKPLAERPYRTKRMKLLFETGAKFYAAFNFRLFWFLFFRKADVLVSNDLDTLLANHWAKKFKRNCRLVYDSHEYFTEVPELIDRPKVQRFWLRIERKIFPKLIDIYTVNESIAKIYQDLYSKELKVVRNVSHKWEPQSIKSKTELGIDETKPMIILQGAGINVERGGEEAVEAMKSVDAVLYFVGDGDVILTLKQTVEEENLAHRVKFVGRVPYQEMMNYTYHADIGLTLDKPRSMNYKFSLPNKVFDYMHATTAIVATDIVEVKRVVESCDIGKIVEPFSSDSLASTLNELLSNPEQLSTYKKNCIKASKVHHWEAEQEVLKTIYPKVD